MSPEPRRLGKYEMQSRLAQGGMGEVWKALDTQLQRLVAIKLLHTERQDDPDFVTRFEREAQLIASLRHPNIVKIHDFHTAMPPEVEAPMAYMVMDYVQGQTLADYIRSTSRKGQFPSSEDLLYIFTATSLAIDYAHRQGMVHRDIKPANILLDKRLPTARSMGEPILTDFGIARLQGAPSGTIVGSLLGTPLYISPEQAQGQHGDGRSDLYSLGVILYEMMTGVTPFRGDTTMAILMQHLHMEPMPPHLINPRISLEASAVILKSLAKDPNARFESAAALTIALAQALNMPVPRSLQQGGAPSIPLGSSRTLPAPTPAYLATQPAITPTWTTPQAGPVGTQPFGQQADPITPPNSMPGFSPTPNVLSSGNNYVPNALMPQQMGVQGYGVPGVTAQQPLFKRWYTILTIVLLIVLIGGGIGYFVLNRPGSVLSTSVGQVKFGQSAGAAKGYYDQIEIDLQNVTPPAEGYTYYAWIITGSLETATPHWPLKVEDGNIHSGILQYNKQNLLQTNSLFIITRESSANAPVVPYTDPDARLYYAQVSPATTTFTVQRCPQGGNSSACFN